MAAMVAIEAKAVFYRYPSGTLAIDNLNIKILQGEKVGIIGPNGAGKSTFLTLLNGLRIANGVLKVFGLPLSGKKNITEIRRRVGLVFQNPDDQLFMTEVYDDLAFGPRNLGLSEDTVEERVSEALQTLNSSGLRDRSTVQISFGQKKLIAIAGVLAMQPALIALDEPSGNIDAFHRRKLIDWMQMSRQTIVVTSHDLDLLWDTCTRIILLNKGRVVADAPTQVVLKNKTLLMQNQLELPLRLQV